MKRVSIKVAKALKGAGYPQETNTAHYVTYEDDVFFHDWAEKECAKWRNMYAAPTYLDVWLWLWREKGIIIKITQCTSYVSIGNKLFSGVPKKDPEEAIIATIEWLVDNNFIKKYGK